MTCSHICKYMCTFVTNKANCNFKNPLQSKLVSYTNQYSKQPLLPDQMLFVNKY